jgi:hypothetical protein
MDAADPATAGGLEQFRIHMIGRIMAALAFVAGGIFTWVVLAGLQGFGSAQAGMGDGAGSGRSSGEGMIPYMATLYFIMSAVGVVACRKRDSLFVVAGVAHSFLLLAFLALCSEGLGSGSGNILPGLVLVFVLTLVFFSPWLLIWAYFLFRRKEAA